MPGVSAQSADGLIALREGVVAYSDAYKTGSVVPIEVRLFNNARQSVKLTGVTAGSAGSVVLVGGTFRRRLPPPRLLRLRRRPRFFLARSLPLRPPSASKSPTPSPTPAVVGSSKIGVEIPVNGFVALSQGTKTVPRGREALRRGAARLVPRWRT